MEDKCDDAFLANGNTDTLQELIHHLGFYVHSMYALCKLRLYYVIVNIS